MSVRFIKIIEDVGAKIQFNEKDEPSLAEEVASTPQEEEVDNNGQTEGIPNSKPGKKKSKNSKS